jgi:hypothetical protein
MEASRADMDMGGGRRGAFCISKRPAATIRFKLEKLEKLQKLNKLAKARFCAA